MKGQPRLKYKVAAKAAKSQAIRDIFNKLALKKRSTLMFWRDLKGI